MSNKAIWFAVLIKEVNLMHKMHFKMEKFIVKCMTKDANKSITENPKEIKTL